MKRVLPFLLGGAGGLALLGFFFGVMALANSLGEAGGQLRQLWYYIAPLVLGFGFQAGLYVYIRQRIRASKASATSGLAASGGMSTVSMIACCAHHLSDALPLLGLSAAAAFLAQYQKVFLLGGILSNLVGIVIMLDVLQRHLSSSPQGPFLSWMGRVRIAPLRKGVIVGALAIFSVSLALALSSCQGGGEKGKPAGTALLPARSDSQAGVTFAVKPVEAVAGKPVVFDISLDTHSGSLDFDLLKISRLEDDIGEVHPLASWEGDPPGGHHRSGTLTFHPLSPKAKAIKLTIMGVSGVAERAFTWDLAPP